MGFSCFRLSLPRLYFFSAHDTHDTIIRQSPPPSQRISLIRRTAAISNNQNPMIHLIIQGILLVFTQIRRTRYAGSAMNAHQRPSLKNAPRTMCGRTDGRMEWVCLEAYVHARSTTVCIYTEAFCLRGAESSLFSWKICGAYENLPFKVLYLAPTMLSGLLPAPREHVASRPLSPDSPVRTAACRVVYVEHLP